MNDRPLNIVMLAGGLRASVFRKQLGIPTLRLPVGGHRTMMDAWLAAFESLEVEGDIRIVVSLEDDVQQLGQLAGRHVTSNSHDLHVSVRKDPAPWRGTGGLLRDVTTSLDEDDYVLAVESSCIPPASLHPIMSAMREGLSGLVGCTTNQEPCGVYLFRKRAFDDLPDEGFCDLKEQGLPRMYENDVRLRSVRLVDRNERILDLASYLSAVRSTVGADPDRSSTDLAPSGNQIGTACRILGRNIIETDVRIESGAVVQDGIVLEGAVIEAGAVVCRSIVGFGAIVPSGRIVRDEIVPFAADVTSSLSRLPIRQTPESESLVMKR